MKLNQDMEVYLKTSPMTNINKASTPTLIQHGEFDKRVPIPNAYELYRGLQDRGIPSKLIVYKGFGHGINKPKERQSAGEKQKQLSKEFVREWLIANNFMGKEGQTVPDMSDEWIQTISNRYIELYEKVIGEKFVPVDINEEETHAVIEKALEELV